MAWKDPDPATLVASFVVEGNYVKHLIALFIHPLPTNIGVPKAVAACGKCNYYHFQRLFQILLIRSDLRFIIKCPLFNWEKAHF